MLKPYNRQQIQTDKMLSDIGDTHYREMLTQILTHEDTLYNVIPSTKYNTITNICCTSTYLSYFQPIITSISNSNLSAV